MVPSIGGLVVRQKRQINYSKKALFLPVNHQCGQPTALRFPFFFTCYTHLEQGCSTTLYRSVVHRTSRIKPHPSTLINRFLSSPQRKYKYNYIQINLNIMSRDYDTVMVIRLGPILSDYFDPATAVLQRPCTCYPTVGILSESRRSDPVPPQQKSRASAWLSGYRKVETAERTCISIDPHGERQRPRYMFHRSCG